MRVFMAVSIMIAMATLLSGGSPVFGEWRTRPATWSASQFV